MSKVSGKPITENRIRQIFKAYIIKAGLDRVYGTDKLGRQLRKFTVHSVERFSIGCKI